MTTVFHARQQGGFIELIKSNFRRKKHYSTNQGSKFLGSSFNNGGNIRSPIQFEEKKSDA